MTDHLGLAKVLPIKKLVSIVEKWVSRPMKSHFAKKDADAAAYAIQATGNAKVAVIVENQEKVGEIQYQGDELLIKGRAAYVLQILPNENNLELRTRDRELNQSMRKQLNIEGVLSKTADQLLGEPSVEDAPLNDDWCSRFFNNIEDISNEDMQNLWSKILSGEIKSPGSFALRTLDTVRNLTKFEAKIFEKYSNMAFKTRTGSFLLKEKEKMDYGEVMHLMEAGVLNYNSTATITFDPKTDGFVEYFVCGQYCLIVSGGIHSKFTIPVYVFTKAGNELLTVIEPINDLGFVKSLRAFLQGFDNLKIVMGKVNSLEGVDLNYDVIND